MESLKQGTDTLFILLGAIMVLAMHAGFAFLELGTVRKKNQVNALAKTAAHFELVPGLPSSTAVPTYAGLPVGSSHTVADVRGDVDWAALAAAPGPLILRSHQRCG